MVLLADYMKRIRTFSFLMALALAAAPVLAVAQDTTQCEWTNVERIVAVGDVHADYGQLVKCLRAAQVIDGTNAWIGGETHLVQTGDTIGRGEESKKVLDLLMDLEGQAAKAGGAVHCLIGNHEAFLLANYFDYLPAEDVAAFGGKKELVKAASPAGKYGRWIRGHNAVIRINDILFAHAGLTPEESGKSLQEINTNLRKAIGESLELRDTDIPLLWTRSLANDKGKKVKEFIGPELERLNAKRIVIGHTVSKGKINPRAGGAVIQIDVGMTARIGGPAMCLVIEKGIFFEVSEKGRKELDLSGKEPAVEPAGAVH